jgi:hypothetical protein
MNLKILGHKEEVFAELVSDKILINDTGDALDLMAEASSMGANKIIIDHSNINSDFFNLKTGMAGEILQKFSTYNVRLAIIGDFSVFPGKSLQDFIRESNRHGMINFVSNREEALLSLGK